MKLTLSVDDRLAERAREVARVQGKSLEELVKDYLDRLVKEQGAERDPEQIERDIAEFKALSPSGTRSWKFNREEIYDRPVFYR